jgi:L-2-hydroxyglutarate oxidase LhgO
VFQTQEILILFRSSSDISKAVRIDYGSSKMYMQLAIEAIDEWNKWNIERSKQGLGPIYHNTGVLVMATNSRFTDNEINSIKNIKEAGHSNYIEELTAEQIKNRYPFLTEAVGKGYDIAYVNNVGGIV